MILPAIAVAHPNGTTFALLDCMQGSNKLLSTGTPFEGARRQVTLYLQGSRMIKLHVLHILLLLSLLTLGSCTGTEITSRIDEGMVLINAFVIDGTGAEPIDDAVIVISDGRISAVEQLSELEISSHAETIDVYGATILPGFINSHVHAGYSSSNLRAWARAGVTTVRDLGADHSLNLAAIRDNLLTEPTNARLAIAGPILTEPSGYPIIPFGGSSALTIATVEDARNTVNALIDEGMDVIKVAVEYGEIFGREIPVLSDEKLEEIVRAAHGRGTLVSAHISVSQDLERALDAEADDLAHMAVDVVSDALIERMIAEDVSWVPTLELWQGVGYGFVDIGKENLRRFVAAGGKVALGTDYAGYWTPFELGMPMTEIRLMQEAGMTPMQIIVAATRNAAHVCNRETDLGTLEEGKIADILVVEGNPLDDLSTLLNVRMVIKDGIIIHNSF